MKGKFKSLKSFENWLKQGKAVYIDRLETTMRYTYRTNGICCSIVGDNFVGKSIYYSISELYTYNPRKKP